MTYQVVCDHCGKTPDDFDAEYSSWDDADDANEAWSEAGGISVGGRRACDNTECGIAFLDSHTDLIARSAANSADRWWVVFDRRWSEYAAFSEYGWGPVLIESSRSLADVMDEVWTW